MRENVPEISFERSMNHNYMILSQCSFFGKDGDQRGDYRTKMLLENRIPGLLPVTHRLINGESRYYYEINSLQSLDRLYDKSEIRYDGLRHLMTGCVDLFDRLEEYLLDGTQIIIRPELIYIDVERMEPYFVCYPHYEGDVRISFMEFIDQLLTRIDHTDECAVMLGYQIYRYTRNPNYVISEIRNMMGHVIADLAHRENDAAQSRPEPTGYVSDAEDADEYNICRADGHGRSGGQAEIDDTARTPDPYAGYSCEEEEAGAAVRADHAEKTRKIGDLIGGIFCIFVSLCSGAIILGARLIHSFTLGGNSELYLYCAAGMAIAAAVLFFSCYVKKRRQDRTREQPDEDEDSDDCIFYTAAGSAPDDGRSSGSQRESCRQEADRHGGILRTAGSAGTGESHPARSACGETVYLGEGIVEERLLCGRMNGREVSLSLDRLPMTVGKLANVSDFVIDDAAVSKMHARFEERDGRVYVRDLNSTNGTVRNGVLLEVNQAVALEPGDKLRFGRTSFTYC